LRLDQTDYQRLAAVLNVTASDPGVSIRRHPLLAMVTPLQLIERDPPTRWDQIRLTPLGQELAESADPSQSLERALRSITFAKPPWVSLGRQKSYSAFDIQPYAATETALEALDGTIDATEFNLFLSRTRIVVELPDAIQMVEEFRQLTDKERQELLDIVDAATTQARSAKAAQNWHDEILHTFALFSLGQTMERRGRILHLTVSLTSVKTGPDTVSTTGESQLQRPLIALPDPTADSDLEIPPLGAAQNTGADAETYVAKLLHGAGWTVAFYTRRRGFGFDLWARRPGYNMVVEVKSSLGRLSTVSLTPNEFAAAQKYGDNFVLALVEHVDTEPVAYFISTPTVKISNIKQVVSHEYQISGSDWRAAL
jgi:hypothetical protein